MAKVMWILYHSYDVGRISDLGRCCSGRLSGGLIGFDRELADKAAGLRTHMLVAAAAALLISLTNVIMPNLEINQDWVRMDPIRMIQAIVTGITFLGAGTIIRHKSDVEGLTTTASLLIVVTIGVTVALSQYYLAIGLTILNLLILRGIKILEKHVPLKRPAVRKPNEETESEAYDRV
mgnify:CR=1 FL=1